ncbi:MAG TPA: hypothetical protein VN759_01280 [Pseudolysinimonas sp.]|nr:hypothetical protein [Pseudolysinimonas sp.]
MNRVRLLLIVFVAPVAIGLIALALQLGWLPALPSPAVVHWSASGPDGTGPAWQLPVVTLAVAVLLPAVFTIIVVLGFPRDALPLAGKAAAVAPLFAVTVVSVAITTGVGIQRGIRSAAQAPELTPWIPLALAAGAVAAAVGWFVLPRARRPSDRAQPSRPLDLAPGERAVWVGRAHPSPAGSLALSIGIALLTALAAFAVAATGGRAWPVFAVPIVIAALFVGFLHWRVRIDETGLRVRSVLGWPVIRVRPDRIRRVGTLDVTPMAYGGWGLRGVPGGTIGVITRSGEGLVVARVGRGDLVVTIDDAQTAAALLGSLTSPEPAGSR